MLRAFTSRASGAGDDYLTVAQLPIGLLINFRRRKLEYKRVRNQEGVDFKEELAEEKLPF